jgi:hypothetical protein
VDVFSVFDCGFHADRSSDPAFGKQQVGAGIAHAWICCVTLIVPGECLQADGGGGGKETEILGRLFGLFQLCGLC